MIVNTDSGSRPLRGGPVAFRKMIAGGNGDMNYSGYGAFPNQRHDLAGFGAFPQFRGFGDDAVDTSTDDSGSIMSTIDSILGSGAKLGQAYTSYLTRNRPTPVAAAAVRPVVAGGIPTWIWVVGGVALVGGAYLLLKK